MTDKPPTKVKDDDAPMESTNPFITNVDEGVDSSEPGEKKRRTRSDAGKPRGPRRGPRSSTLAKKISAAFAMVAAGVATVDAFDSQIILHNADRLGNAWAPVVEQNPKIKAFFDSLEKGGVWGNAIFSTLAVALPITLNHRADLLPAPLRAVAMSMIPPDIAARMVFNHPETNAAFHANGSGQ